MTEELNKLAARYIEDTFGPIPQCFRCRHYRGGAGCDAFDVIPDEIFANEHDHKKPYPGDGGIRFSQKG